MARRPTDLDAQHLMRMVWKATFHEYQMVHDAAKDANLTASSWMRRVCMEAATVGRRTAPVMDEPVYARRGSRSGVAPVYACGRCGEIGHNRRTCPNPLRSAEERRAATDRER